MKLIRETRSDDGAQRAAAWSWFPAQIQSPDSLWRFHARGDCDIFVEMKKKSHTAFMEAQFFQVLLRTLPLSHESAAHFFER
jgi:hypothetical protein